MKEITIVVDINDADYITAVNRISEKDLAKIKPLIKAISEFKEYKGKSGKFERTHRHNYPQGERLRKDLGEKSVTELYDFSEEVFEVFEELLPTGEYGLHTIKTIYISSTANRERLL